MAVTCEHRPIAEHEPWGFHVHHIVADEPHSACLKCLLDKLGYRPL